MQRRLAAILATDMVGYSRLMAADETGTLARHKAHRAEIIDPRIAKHEGRLTKTTGDGFLVEFSSAVHAVQCAVEIQQAIAEQEATGSKERRIQYRMGINLADIVADEGDIFGDGVNVAARLEQLADAGAVCISEVVYQNVKSKLKLQFESLGAKVLKNMPGEIHVYRIRSENTHGGLSGTMALAEKPELPGKPSIAVLPFANLSNVRDQDFFADGVTEDIITALSRIRDLFVISRNSSFVYKDRAVRIEDVARELGVKFVLEGSVRVAGNRVRVTAQLIDGLSGGHVWAERFDGELDDIFAVQDEITRNIALAMQVKLTTGESARLWEGQTRSLRAWEKMAGGRELFLRWNSIDNREAQRVLKEALSIDPNYTGAMVQLGLSYQVEARFNPSSDLEHCLRLAEQQVERALKIDPDLGIAYSVSGGIAYMRDQHDQAIELSEKSVELAPSDSFASAHLAVKYFYGGDARKAIAALKTAMRLSPHSPAWYTYQFAWANLWSGDLAAAQEAAEAHLRREPDDPYSYMVLTVVYGFQQRQDDAVRTMSELKQRFPAYGMRDINRSQRYREREKFDRVVDLLRRAGLPA